MQLKCNECRRTFNSNDDKCTHCGTINRQDSHSKTPTSSIEANKNTPTRATPTLESKVDKLNARLDQVLQTLHDLQKENVSLVKENQDLKARCTSLEKRTQHVQKLEDRLDNLEQYTRRNNIVISGIPLLKDEDTNELVKSCSQAVGVNLAEEIDTCHRLPTKNGKCPNIVVRLLRRTTKGNIIQKWKEKRPTLKDIGLKGMKGSNPIYISEHLTPRNASIYYSLRQLKKQQAIQYICTKDCKIFTRIKDGQPTRKIKSQEDLEKLKANIQESNLQGVTTRRNHRAQSTEVRVYKQHTGIPYT